MTVLCESVHLLAGIRGKTLPIIISNYIPSGFIKIREKYMINYYCNDYDIVNCACQYPYGFACC